METVGKVVTHFWALAPQHVRVSMVQSNGGCVGSQVQFVSGEIVLQKWAGWGVGWLSSIRHIHSVMALCSVELPHPARQG